MDGLSKLQVLTGNMNAIKKEANMDAESSWHPKPRHLYEGTDSEDDEYITSGRAVGDSGKTKKPNSPQGRISLPDKIVYPSNGDADYDFEIGQLAAENECFCQFQAIKKYPYTFIGKANKDKVEKGFFTGGKLYEYSWDFFYLYPDLDQQPIILVPTRQFEKFLTTINQKLGTSLGIPIGAKGAFTVQFSNNETPRPRYLGRVLTKVMADELKENVPPSSFILDNESDDIGASNEKDVADFQKKIELLRQVQKGNKTSRTVKQKKEQLEKKKTWGDSIKRVQHYLGIRAIEEGGGAEIRASLMEPGLERYEYNAAVQASVAKLPPTVAFDPRTPAQFNQEGSVVFISIDVEAYERNTKQVTEIGISTLDTKDITSMSPGEGGKNWMAAIRPRHFRIKEHLHLNNTEFISGCADRFEFGDSEFINLHDAPYVISTCFKHPFSQPGIEAIEENPKRNIILVGHDIGSDIKFLQTIGYDVTNLSNLIEVVDTATMWKYHTQEINPRKLGSVIADLGITGWNLHNAGNDAAYTLQAMVAIAIKHLELRQKQKGIKGQEKKTDTSNQEPANMAPNKGDGRSSTGNNSDDGNPIFNLPTTPATNKPQSQHAATVSNGTKSYLSTPQPQTLENLVRQVNISDADYW